MEIAAAVIFLSIALFLLYKFFIRNYDYWEKRGVPYVKPTPLFGNFLDVFLMRNTIGHLLADFYNQFKTPYFGIYILNKPYLVLRSPELIKAVLVKDFNYFQNHVTVCDETIDSVPSKQLFFSKNPEWKAMRNKITPAFSSGKIKNMLALVNKAAEDMTKYIEKNYSKGSLEGKELCAKYSTDVVASCAFGLEAHCFENEDAVFRAIGRKIFGCDLQNAFRQVSYFILPGLVKALKMRFFEPSVTKFMREMVWETINQRKKTQHKRNDVIDILIQIQQQNKPGDVVNFEGDVIVAQAGQFYTAGFETVSSTLSFTLYELALHPEIQTKAREEILSCIEKHGGVTYEAVQDMKYLHMIICETLRVYPVLPFLDRRCEQDYKLPDSDLIVEKGTPVFIPMFGLHYDPEYFPEPEVYNPERFSEENKPRIPAFCYIPFGEGPRVCIGERFGVLVTKIGLVNILLRYEIERNSLTPVPLKYEKKSFLLLSEVGLPISFKKRSSE